MEPTTSRESKPSNKKRNPNEDHQNRAVPRSADPETDIFKLNVECFEEVFEYLDIHDLVSFGQTCKWLQQVTGKWFRENYVGRKIFAKSEHIETRASKGFGNLTIDCFSQHITNISFSERRDDNIGSESEESEIEESESEESECEESECVVKSSESSKNEDDYEHRLAHYHRILHFIMSNDTNDGDGESDDSSNENDDKNINHDQTIDKFIQSVRPNISEYIHQNIHPFRSKRSHRLNFLEPYQYIQSNCSQSFLNTIKFDSCKITKTKINCIKNILNSVKSIKLANCDLKGDVHKKILKLCKNITHLHIIGNIDDPTIIGYDNRWLQQKYPTLEHFVFEPHAGRINELWDFFRFNPNIRKFSTETDCVLTNLEFFLKSNLKFETFAICFYGFDGLHLVCDVLETIYTCKFYEKLYFCFGKQWKICQDDVYLLASLDNLNKLQGKLSRNVALSALINLEELFIDESAKVTDWADLPCNLPNLQRVRLSVSSIGHILILISKAVKLKKIMVYVLINHHFNDKVLDIFALNKAREKLIDAQKVTIYVDEAIYIATKRTMKQTECNLVEIKRIESIDWFNEFDFDI